MQNLSVSEITQAGEKCMEEWLFENGFKNTKTYNIPNNKSEMTADGNVENILIHLRVSLADATAARLNSKEKEEIMKRAAELDRKAYIAYVTVDEYKNISKEIAWEKLRLLD